MSVPQEEKSFTISLLLERGGGGGVAQYQIQWAGETLGHAPHIL